ncbi:hypothetical protein CPT_Shady_057 [Streptomyces phage Shady]|uniref:Uncharacterized protein n=1 Tax=Streptomyces phage Shady TaxID=2767585 RepID=A0A873WI22_9CAUD|nr:hypothetical protein CPT_Shady_057 [Streptomyces phage Shady]
MLYFSCRQGNKPKAKGRNQEMNAKPKTKAAKNIKPGDWVSFGSLAWQAGAVEVDGDVTYITFGYFPWEYKSTKRMTMHYDA